MSVIYCHNHAYPKWSSIIMNFLYLGKGFNLIYMFDYAMTYRIYIEFEELMIKWHAEWFEGL